MEWVFSPDLDSPCSTGFSTQRSDTLRNGDGSDVPTLLATVIDGVLFWYEFLGVNTEGGTVYAGLFKCIHGYTLRLCIKMIRKGYF